MVTDDARRLRFDVPLYSLSDAARHLNVPRTTFDAWVRGYSRQSVGRPPITGAPVVASIGDDRGGPRIPFVGLAEGFVLAAFRKAGVPLQRIRPALIRLQEEIGLAHVLASQALYTDGAEVLYDFAERGGDSPEARSARELVVVRNDQRVFGDVVEAYLKRVEFAPDGWASVIHLPQYRGANVVVDPTRSFGAPIFSEGAAPVEVVLGRFKAGESLEDLSSDFGVPLRDLTDALRAHTDIAA